ncbi:MAG: DUF4167 domain-containing protein [Proteobacteria bacterium]|nr:DUF4167 domain-containing protein [Pseudomonadota bacterium]
MRQGSNGRRPRGRPHRKQQGAAPRHNNFDSNGPEGRVRGNAHQVYEKYIGLAHDAQSAGDRVATENYFQYAEHYYRVLNARTDPRPNGEDQPGRQSGNGQTEAAGAGAGGGVEGGPSAVAGTGEQPRAATPTAEQTPAAQPPAAAQTPTAAQPPRQAPVKARRRSKAASAEEPEPEAGPSEDSESAET